MNVFVADEQALKVDLAWIRHVAVSVLEAEQCPAGTEVSVMLVSDDDMARYNRDFMDKDGPTDVLSFPIEELRPGLPPAQGTGGAPLMLGDVVLDPGYIQRQASELGVGFEDEIALMVVHGILHLLGYDHDDDSAAEEMEERERGLLAALGRGRR